MHALTRPERPQYYGTTPCQHHRRGRAVADHLRNQCSESQSQKEEKVNLDMRRQTNRFSNYREIVARFESTGACGHTIKKGDLIGYNHRHGSQCANCWSKWVAENREADAIEAGYIPSCW